MRGYCPVSNGGQKESGIGIGSIQEHLEEMQLLLAIMRPVPEWLQTATGNEDSGPGYEDHVATPNSDSMVLHQKSSHYGNWLLPSLLSCSSCSGELEFFSLCYLGLSSVCRQDHVGHCLKNIMRLVLLENKGPLKRQLSCGYNTHLFIMHIGKYQVYFNITYISNVQSCRALQTSDEVGQLISSLARNVPGACSFYTG